MRSPSPVLVLPALLLLAALAARADVREPLPGCEGFEEELAQDPALHDCLRFDQIQVIGTHNSYKLQPVEPYRTVLFTLLANFDPVLGPIAWDYEHLPLDRQFGEQGIRQIELDVFTDPEGGLYAYRFGPVIAGYPAPPVPELDEPGIKVLHVQDLDFETTCYALRDCLETLVAWSDANPTHLPLFVLVELKDEPVEPDLGFAVPLPWDATQMDVLDEEILAVVPREKLVVPDDVRGARATLEEAIRLDGWPAIGRLRGKVLFAMDNAGTKREIYTDGRPSAEGRVLFPNAVEGDPDAAFVKLNDPIGDFDRIQAAVAAGYLVRTRADADTVEARSGDSGPRDAALASGAQFVSTDYPVPDPRFGTGYEVSFPDRTVARCNPVVGVEGCAAAELDGFVPVPEPGWAASLATVGATLAAAAAVRRRAS